MPRRPNKKNKIIVFGELTLANCLDWCVVLTLALTICFTIFQVGGARPETMVISSFLIGIALVLHTLSLIAEKPTEPFRLSMLGFIFLPYWLYLLVQWLFLTDYPWKGQEELMIMTQGIIIFWLVMNGFRTRNHVWVMMLALLGISSLSVLIAIMQYFHSPEWLPKIIDPINGESYPVKLSEQYHGRASGTFGAPTSYSVQMLMIGFALLAAGFSKRFSSMARAFLVYIGFMMLAGIIMSITRGALLLMIGGLFLIPIVTRAKLKTVLIAWMLSIIGIGITGFTMLQISDSFRDRVVRAIDEGGETTRPAMWNAAWQQFLEAPVLGNGLGAYEFKFEEHRPEGFNRSPKHAHNDYLETLADQGVVGFALFWLPVIFIAILAAKEWFNQPDLVRLSGLDTKVKRSMRMPTPKLLIGSLGLGMALFCAHLFLEFHLRVPGLLFLFFLFLAVIAKCVPMPRVSLPRNLVSILGVLALGFGLAVALPLWEAPRFAALVHIQNGQAQLQKFISNLDEYKRDEAYYETMIESLKLGTERAPGNAIAWSNLSNAIALQNMLRPSQNREFGQESEGYARRALELYPRDATAWINLGHALSLQGRMIEARQAYEKSVELAPNRADVWHHYASHLNHLKSTRPEALTAIDRALELEPGRGESLELRRKILVP
ncbi:MAG: O-antigen ligase family protein [Verrucomicrobiota bacterium]